MGLLHSALRLCPCSTPRKTTITPETISHPYPLAPKYTHTHSQPQPHTRRESRFRPTQIHGQGRQFQSQENQGPYHQLDSPAQSHSKTMSESTTSTTPQIAPFPLMRDTPVSGLGLGLMGDLRAPDRAYVLAERGIGSIGGGTGAVTGTGRSRKLKKARMVEGDWELVRTDYDYEGGQSRSRRSSRIEKGSTGDGAGGLES